MLKGRILKCKIQQGQPCLYKPPFTHGTDFSPYLPTDWKRRGRSRIARRPAVPFVCHLLPSAFAPECPQPPRTAVKMRVFHTL